MKALIAQRFGAVAALSATVLAAGCSGAGSSSVSPQAATGRQTAASTKALLTIKLPLRKAAAKSAKRQPRYVSLYTQELAIRAGVAGSINAAPWQLFDVSGSSPLCTTSANLRTCAVEVSAPVVAGTQDEFQIEATDRAPASTDTIPMGNALSGDDVTQSVTAGAANPISVALTSIIGQLSTDQPKYTVWAAPGQTANITVNVTANDVDGGQISGFPASFENPISFADTLAASPFTYPNPSATFLGVPPPADAGPIAATIAYAAPTAAAAAAATVTVSTIVPDYLSLATPPSAVFAINPLTVSVGSTPVSAIPGLSATASAPVTVTVAESGATQFTVTANNGSSGAVSLPGLPANGVLTPTAGTATFTVQGVVATSVATDAPTITIVDQSGTKATITAVVGP